jgi:hypothetical protein
VGRSPAWSSPSKSVEISLDQVQDGGKNHICMWSGHLTEFFSAFLVFVSSLRPLLKG